MPPEGESFEKRMAQPVDVGRARWCEIAVQQVLSEHALVGTAVNLVDMYLEQVRRKLTESRDLWIPDASQPVIEVVVRGRKAGWQFDEADRDVWERERVSHALGGFLSQPGQDVYFHRGLPPWWP